MLAPHIGPVIASAPAFGMISSVLLSFAALAIASATPECTVPTSTSTLSRLISLLTLSVRLGRLGFVVDLEVLDLAPAELAALLLHVELEAVLDRVAERGVGAAVGQHQADLDRAARALRRARASGMVTSNSAASDENLKGVA